MGSVSDTVGHDSIQVAERKSRRFDELVLVSDAESYERHALRVRHAILAKRSFLLESGLQDVFE